MLGVGELDDYELDAVFCGLSSNRIIGINFLKVIYINIFTCNRLIFVARYGLAHLRLLLVTRTSFPACLRRSELSSPHAFVADIVGMTATFRRRLNRTTINYNRGWGRIFAVLQNS